VELSEGWGIGRQKGKREESGNPSVEQSWRSGRLDFSVVVLSHRIILGGFSTCGTGWLIVQCPKGATHPPCLELLSTIGGVSWSPCNHVVPGTSQMRRPPPRSFQSFHVECNTNRRFAEAALTPEPSCTLSFCLCHFAGSIAYCDNTVQPMPVGNLSWGAIHESFCTPCRWILCLPYIVSDGRQSLVGHLMSQLRRWYLFFLDLLLTA
jgi:hypothetical protein